MSLTQLHVIHSHQRRPALMSGCILPLHIIVTSVGLPVCLPVSTQHRYLSVSQSVKVKSICPSASTQHRYLSVSQSVSLSVCLHTVSLPLSQSVSQSVCLSFSWLRSVSTQHR